MAIAVLHQQQEVTMMLLKMKTYVALLLGISVLLSTESTSASIPDTSSVYSTAEPDKMTTLMISEHALQSETPKPPEVSDAPPVKTTASPTVEEAVVTDRRDSSNGSTSGLADMKTIEPTSSSGPRLLHTSAVATTAAGVAHPHHNPAILETTKPAESHQQSPTTAIDKTAPAAISATVALLLQPTLTTKPKVTSKLPSTTSSANSTQAPIFIQTLSGSSAPETVVMTDNPTSETAPVFRPTKSLTSTDSTEILPTQSVSVTGTPIFKSSESAEPRSTTEPATDSFSTDEVSTNNVSTTNVSTTDVSPTIVSTTSVSTTTVSATDVSPTIVSATNFSTTVVSTTNVSTTNFSTTPAGVLIPLVPKKLPAPTTKQTSVTTASPSTEAQRCSTRGVVTHCLIAIASLAALATIFMITTIILCTKLSARKYKVKKPQPATEMMCISALLPERNYTYTRQRNPVTNGVLVIHGGADSDEDGGDNLTLSSFLPENDRFV
ncbi:P-selectin glycoprotein ligand 1 [Plectropomus leopardus]|uniref:P-selectin glycoprotein ligand 1 n=1 Tax=Plectropomus leopardus TaxID=160734 RepID=UPI001C4D1244|nr:P-selectin glycoprotein ligand 1 [Plectropomus leopardus]